MSDLYVGERYQNLHTAIDAWLDGWAADNPAIASIERGTSDGTPLGEPRWYVRMVGESKDFITVWLTLGQRTLRYETYVLPAPIDHVDAVRETLLKHNDRLVGAHFSIGAEDAIYLRGEVPNAALDEDELDRVIGTMYTTVEETFQPLVRLAFASRFVN